MNAVRVAVAVVEHAGCVLIGPRPEGKSLAGCWEFPGGKVLPGESAAEAAVRECREETGLCVRIGPLLAEVRHEYPDGPLHLFFFRAAPAETEQTPLAPFRWVPIRALAQYSFPAANSAILAQLLQIHRA